MEMIGKGEEGAELAENKESIFVNKQLDSVERTQLNRFLLRLNEEMKEDTQIDSIVKEVV